MISFSRKLLASTMAVALSLPVFAADVVNIYSARHYDTDIALYENFEKRTGVKVNLIEAPSDTLIERIVNEGKYSPADILVTVDAGRLFRAEQRGIFSPVESDVLDARIPAHLRHPDGLWYGLSKRARIIIYNKERGLPEGLNSYEDMADPKFSKQICVRSSSNIYNISLLASLVEHDGEEAAEAWAQGVMDNLLKKPQGNDVSNIRAVASGECRISIVNTYYVARLQAEGDESVKAVGVLFPNQEEGGYGAHVNISGAGVLKHAPNRANAIAFLEYLTEPEAQKYFVEANHEYSVGEGAETDSVLEAMGDFKEDTINASALGEHQVTAVKIFDRVGWN